MIALYSTSVRYLIGLLRILVLVTYGDSDLWRFEWILIEAVIYRLRGSDVKEASRTSEFINKVYLTRYL